MKKLLLILFGLLLAVYVSGQATRVYNQNIQINKTTPILDLQGLGAKIYLDGATSGTATLQPPAVAGATVHTLPSATGTLTNFGDTVSTLSTQWKAKDLIHDTIQTERDKAVLGIAWEDRYDGSTGNDYFYTKDQVDGLFATGGNGSFTGDILKFIIGTTTGAPSVGDSLIIHSEFTGRHVDLYRNGALQYFITDAVNTIDSTFRISDDTIVVRPDWANNERIEIRLRDPNAWSYLSLEGQESPLLDSLLVYYKLDEIGGTSGDDANNIIWVEPNEGWNAVLGTGTTASTLHAKYNYGRHIGYKSQIRVPYLESMRNTILNSGEFTVSMWIWADSIGATDYLFHFSASSPSIMHYAYINSSGEIRMNTYNTEGPAEYQSKTSITLSDSTLYHVVFVHRGNSYTNKIYVNGTDVTTNVAGENYTFSGTLRTFNDHLFFGNRYTNQTDNFRGYMDECGIWYQAFTPADVTLLYESLVSHPFTE